MAERSSQSLWGYQALVSLPTVAADPFRELVRRALLAVGIVLLNTLIVWLDHESYADNVNGDGVSFIDALYYATVTVTTTGYGDITPVSDHARLLNALLVTPLRIAFLILLVGTTLEVLANEGRRAMIDTRWRKKMRNHTVVLGYGTMGRSALNTLLRNGAESDRIVVVDGSQAAVDEANRNGLAAFLGDATSRELLRRAEVPKAKHIVITVNRDDTAILATLTARQLNPHAHIVAAVRAADNVSLLRQSGADGVITSSDAVGRLTLMRATLLVAALVAIGTAVAPSWGLLLALRAVLGFAVAGLPAVAAAYLREEVAPTWASAATGLYIGGTALGGIRRGAEGRRQYRVMVSTSTFAAIRLSRGSAWRSTFMA